MFNTTRKNNSNNYSRSYALHTIWNNSKKNNSNNCSRSYGLHAISNNSKKKWLERSRCCILQPDCIGLFWVILSWIINNQLLVIHFLWTKNEAPSVCDYLNYNAAIRHFGHTFLWSNYILKIAWIQQLQFINCRSATGIQSSLS